MHDNYYQSKEFEELLTKYEVATHNGDSVYLEPDELTDIAEFYYNHGRNKDAEKACDYALKLFPGSTAPAIFMARMALVNTGDVEKAKDYLQTASDKSDLEYYYMEAELLVYQGKAEEAMQYLENVYATLSDDDDLADFPIDAANLLADYQLYDQALFWLSRSDETDASDYRELKARIAMAQGNFEEGETILNQLIDEDPFDGQYWNHLASGKFMSGKIAEAIDATDFSIAINPNDLEAINTKAHALFALGRYEDAYQWFKRYTDISPNDENTFLYEGMALVNMEHIDEAIDCFKKGEALLFTNVETRFHLYQEFAFALARAERFTEAKDYIERASNYVQNNIQQSENEVLYGHILLESGKLEEAQKHFVEAVNVSGQSPHIYLRIAISVYDCGYLQLAYKLLRMLLDNVENDWSDGYSYMALCCHDLELNEQYLEYLKLACQKNPDEARLVLSEIFPDNIPPAEYYEYELNKQKNL